MELYQSVGIIMGSIICVIILLVVLSFSKEVKKTPNLMLFSEYRVSQATFIMEQRHKMNYLSYSIDQFIVLTYGQYLETCGIDDNDLFNELNEIAKYTINKDMKSYNNHIAENLNEYMDNLIKRYLL